MSKIFETVSFHIVKPCNMKCKFCYATFEDMHVGPQMSYIDAVTIISKLCFAGVKKITFAGGEPKLYKHLNAVIKFAKQAGMTTSIITNGSLVTPEWLERMAGSLDWFGISVDSIDDNINQQIGRPQHIGHVCRTIMAAKKLGYKLKINTVVNRYNHHIDLNAFIDWASPDRWKVFQALRVEGQNNRQFDEIKVSTPQFQAFLQRHKWQPSLVPEDNEVMYGSYLLIDPLGRLFEDTAGRHTYSNSLVTSSMDTCLSQINLNRDNFIKRGGLYDWSK